VVQASAIPAQRERVVARRLGEEMVLLNTETEAYFTLNDVGARVWELIDGRQTVATIIRQLLAEYDVPETELQTDVDELLSQFADQQLITWVDGPA
jgi:hypothetical protein